MRWFAFIAATLMAASSPTGAARAAGGVDCVKTQCEGKGNSCVGALYVAYDACMKAGNSKCNAVPPAEKMNCLRSELTPCAVTRNREQAACLTEFQSCYRTCGPLDGTRADYWCVADRVADKRVMAAFCAADPSSSKPMDQCARAFTMQGPSEPSMSCDPLQ
jgi:hypothetical protein